MEGAIDVLELAMLQMHSVRWLSQGQVLERMVKVMPALLMEFGKENPSINNELLIYENQFYIHLLADVCTELNILNCQFQFDLVDIANISNFADATFQNFRKKFLRDPSICGTKYLKLFVEETSNGEITFSDVSGDSHAHKLKSEGIEGTSRGDSFEDFLQLERELVESIVENLNGRMQEDMPIFYACKLFSPKHYPGEEVEQETCINIGCKRY
ncbi:hypothetical protein GOP47_0030310 [Adiantum capillus-veneris]|nr:hypothetical protein GOP47_0030310 [Adiantum capillus-veneris]